MKKKSMIKPTLPRTIPKKGKKRKGGESKKSARKVDVERKTEVFADRTGSLEVFGRHQGRLQRGSSGS